MSRPIKQQIEKALKEKGYNLISASWEPITKGVEMGGPEGGWTIEYEKDGDEIDELSDYIFGYNVGEVLDQIKEL